MKKITYNGESKILIALCNLVNELVDAVGSAGNGDMKKSVYDTDGNGIVDNAEKVNNHTVNANVPEDAKFTDSNTTYTLGKSDGKITLTDSDGLKQEVDVPSTDTNTTYAISIKGHTITLTGSDGTTTNVTVPDNDTKYDDAIKSLNDLLGGHTVKSDVPEGAVFTDTVYNDTAVRQLISDESTRAKKAESTIQQNLDGLGLKVVDGKLCAVYS